ncbi:unnamed protein product [Triticum turgidum subsp. durum]|uniref:Uncharacterized protein n=1 Tax=Triticum turgidum subsp. durum TaxID=4567 RepID=A0A9R1RND1_TRITD|nr:unnamed protein product [Triticum turgidum subsp. durum]
MGTSQRPHSARPRLLSEATRGEEYTVGSAPANHMSPEALCLSYAPPASISLHCRPPPSIVLGTTVAPHWIDAPLSLCRRVQRVQCRNPRPFNLAAMGVPHSNSLACASVAKQCNLQEEPWGVQDVQLGSPTRHDSRHHWPHVRWQDHRASSPAPAAPCSVQPRGFRVAKFVATISLETCVTARVATMAPCVTACFINKPPAHGKAT